MLVKATDLPPAPFTIQNFSGVSVLRDDLLSGGSKSRFLPFVIEDATEVVFGAPFCGGAPVAIADVCRKMKKRATIFYAKRKVLHNYQKRVQASGATLHSVPAGYMAVVQKRARDYAAENSALFLPLGLDVPAAAPVFEAEANRLKKQTGGFDEIWCAAGSGMLVRTLGRAFPEAEVFGVVVGLASRNEKQNYTPNVTLVKCEYDFAQPCKTRPPFPSSENYDAKAWEILARLRIGKTKKRILFWNVLN